MKKGWIYCNIIVLSLFKNIQLNSGGVSLGVGVGYFFGDRYELEFGYLSVPIEAGNSYQIISNSDFGGAKDSMLDNPVLSTNNGGADD